MLIAIIEQITLLLLFLGVSFLIFTIPGLVIIWLLRLKLNSFVERYTLSTVLGFVVFTLLTYVSIIINLRIVVVIYLLASILFALKNRENIINFKRPTLDKKTTYLFLTVLIIGALLQVAVNAPSGLNYQDSLRFWSSHGRDGLWHIALIEEIKYGGYPLQNPIYSGNNLQNYHFFVDILMSEISRLFMFSSFDVYFRFVPVLFSLLLGLSSYIFVRLWSKSTLAGIWAMVFTYMAGSFGYFVTFARYGNIGGETIFWMNQTPSVLGNPPQASAFIVVTMFLFVFLKYLRTRNISYFLLSLLFAGVVIEFKVYAGIILITGLLVVGIYELIFKKTKRVLLLFLLSSLFSMVLFLPNSRNSGSFVIWEPWWFVRTMVVQKLGLIDWEHKRQHYLSVGRTTSHLRIVQLELTAFFIYLVGNLGLRIIGFWKILRDLATGGLKDSFTIFFYTILASSFIIPMLFLQSGVVYNIIQFSQYFLLFFGFLAAISMNEILSKIKSTKTKVILAIIVVILIIPTHLGLLAEFYSKPPLAKITQPELEALDYLKQNVDKDSIIFSLPHNKFNKNKEKSPPIPIYSWSDTSYISAVSARKTLLSDTEQIDILGYEAETLIKERSVALEDETGMALRNLLNDGKVNYIYVNLDEDYSEELFNTVAVEEFVNDNVKIYRVKLQ